MTMIEFSLDIHVGASILLLVLVGHALVWHSLRCGIRSAEAESQRLSNETATFLEPIRVESQDEWMEFRIFLTCFYEALYSVPHQKHLQDLLEQDENLQILYEELVIKTEQVAMEDFWQRYYYKCDPERILSRWQQQQNDDDNRQIQQRQKCPQHDNHARPDLIKSYLHTSQSKLLREDEELLSSPFWFSPSAMARRRDELESKEANGYDDEDIIVLVDEDEVSNGEEEKEYCQQYRDECKQEDAVIVEGTHIVDEFDDAANNIDSGARSLCTKNKIKDDDLTSQTSLEDSFVSLQENNNDDVSLYATDDSSSFAASYWEEEQFTNTKQQRKKLREYVREVLARGRQARGGTHYKSGDFARGLGEEQW